MCETTKITKNNKNGGNFDIYCQGRLLHTVQMAHLYEDSKTFVDMKLKYTPDETLRRFDDMMNETNGQPDTPTIKEFVSETFEEGNELEPWIPSDWTDSPAFVDRIKDPAYRQWALDLNELWMNLTRKMVDDVAAHPDQYSIIYVPNALVIPGGRFKEFYYWDSFWVVRGLLLSEMHSTVRGMLLNFLSMVKQFGFVPNGGRIYFLERSQPPLLIPMVDSYLQVSNDDDFLVSNIDLLEKEFQFWMVNRTVDVTKNGKTYTLCRYYSPSAGPRPESYREDYLIAENLATDNDKLDMYIDLKSAAESGWDFSSRWFINNKTDQGNLSSIHTKHIVPVDLNAIIYWNARILSNFYTKLGNSVKAQQYTGIADKWLEAVNAVLWHEDVGVWLDYDMSNNVRRNYFYPSNLAPLWTNCYDKSRTEVIAEQVVKYVRNLDIMNYQGGVPTSLARSGEQWDLPNAWPPLQMIIIQGLEQMKVSAASNLAEEMAYNWVYSNYLGYTESKEMYEKYDAEHPGQYGGGGEYVVQAGFGWTNGAVMELLNTYGPYLSSTSDYVTGKKSVNHVVSNSVL